MKNLFLNLYADNHQMSIEKAKVAIKTTVWSVIRMKLKILRYTDKEIKEAYDMFTTYKLQGVYDSGIVEVEGRIFEFNKLLA